MDALCFLVFSSLLKLPHMASFMCDLPFAKCSPDVARKMVMTVLSCAVLPKSHFQEYESFEAAAEKASNAFGDFLVSKYDEASKLRTATDLLSCLTNIAVSQQCCTEAVLKVLIEVGFAVPSSSALCYKLVRSCVACVCSSKPYFISVVVAKFSDLNLWSGLLFLLRDLPLSRWIPLSTDLATVKKCLMFPAQFEENKCARMLLNGLDYGWSSANTLVIGAETHRFLALMAVEVMSHHEQQQQSKKSWFGAKTVAFDWAATMDLYEWLWIFIEKLKHADASGKLLVPPLDLSLPAAAQLRTLMSTDASSNSSCLASLWAILFVRLNVPLTTVPSLLERLATSSNAHASKGFVHALICAAPVLGSLTSEVIAPLPELLRMVVTKTLGTGNFLTDPLWALVGTHTKPKTGVVVDLFCALIPAQIARACQSSKAIGEQLMGFWIRHFVAVPGWTRVPEIRKVLDALAKEAFLQDILECVLRALSKSSIHIAMLDFPSLQEVGWSPSAFVPAVLFLASPLLEQRKRISSWSTAHSWLTLSLMIVDSRLQSVEWRAAGRGESPRENMETFAVFQWAFVCEQASDQNECLVLYWQMFFSLYFERSSVGKAFALAILNKVDPGFRARMATCLELLSARKESPVYNAMALWLRYEGSPDVLIDNYAGLPAVYLAKDLLSRFAVRGGGGGGVNVENMDDYLWKDLVRLGEDSKARKDLIYAAPASSYMMPPSSVVRSSIRDGVVVLNAPFAPLDKVPVPRLVLDAPVQKGESWHSTAMGMRGAIVAEMEKMEVIGKAWDEGLALTAALYEELLESLPSKLLNIEDVKVIDRYCQKGALHCDRQAQFVFKCTKVVPNQRVQERIQQIHKLLKDAIVSPLQVEQLLSAVVTLNKKVTFPCLILLSLFLSL